MAHIQTATGTQASSTQQPLLRKTTPEREEVRIGCGKRGGSESGSEISGSSEKHGISDDSDVDSTPHASRQTANEAEDLNKRKKRSKKKKHTDVKINLEAAMKHLNRTIRSLDIMKDELNELRLENQQLKGKMSDLVSANTFQNETIRDLKTDFDRVTCERDALKEKEGSKMCRECGKIVDTVVYCNTKCNEKFLQ